MQAVIALKLENQNFLCANFNRYYIFKDKKQVLSQRLLVF